MDMMTEQFRKIISPTYMNDGTIKKNVFSYCSKVYIGIIDSDDKKPSHGEEWIRRFWSFSSSKQEEKIDNKVEIVFYKDNQELRRTLRWVRDYAKENTGDYILFFHSKGITHYTQATEDWRRYMEYFVIERWRECIEKLNEGYDACGVLWNTDTPIGIHPHFSGAFYWATTDYINSLNHEFIDSDNRFDMEFWIGSNPNARIFEFHNSGYNTKERLIANKGHYNISYPRDNYEIIEQ